MYFKDRYIIIHNAIRAWYKNTVKVINNNNNNNEKH